MNDPQPWEIEFAERLAALPPAERDAALNRVDRRAGMLVPDDELDRPRIPAVPYYEYYLSPPPIPPILVEPRQVLRGSVTALVARAGKGKTTMTLNRIVRWAAGKPMFPDLPDVMVPTGPLRTLIIENEGAPGLFYEALGKIVHNQPDFTDEDVAYAWHNIYIFGEGGYPRIKVNGEDSDLDSIRQAAELAGPDLILMEPFRSLWKGAENSADDMSEALDIITGLAGEFDAGVFLTHHESKWGGTDEGEQMNAARGSTVLEGEVAVMERYKPVRPEVSELQWIKSRYGPPSPPVRMTFDPERWGYTYVSPEQGVREAIAVLMENEGAAMTVAEAVDELGETQSTARRMLNRARDEYPDNVQVLPSTSDGMGSTGKRYRWKKTESDEETQGLTF